MIERFLFQVEDLQKAQEEMFTTIMQQLEKAQAAADNLKDVSGSNVGQKE